MTAARQPLSVGRRVALVFGVLVGVAVIGFGVLALISWLTPTTTVERTFTMNPQTSRLSVDVGSGDVRLTHGTGSELQVRRTSSYVLREPQVEERADSSGATITAGCPAFFGFNCSVDYEIAVPDGYTVDLHASSGGLNVTGVNAERLRAGVSSGRIDLADVTAPLELDASSGSVNADRLTSPTVTAKVSSGEVTLDFAAAPSNVSVEASSGDVTLKLPTAAGPYRVSVDTSSGAREVNVPTDPSSPRAITVNVSSGDVQILPR